MRSPIGRWGCALVALSIALTACGKPKSDERSRREDEDDRASRREKERDPEPSPGKFRVAVSGATVDETLTAYRRATGNDLGMKDTVRRRIDCVRVTFSVERDSAQDVERALADKLGEYGLKIEERLGLHGVVRDYAKPSPCQVAGREDDPEPLDVPVPTRRLPGTTDPPPEGIEKVSEDHYRIERTAFEQLKAEKPPRVMPHKSGADHDGMALYSVRHNGVLYALGFRSGDILKRVNGVNLTDPTQAMDAYSKLQGANAFIVELERRSKPLTVRIEVVPDGTVGKPVVKTPTALP